MKNIVAISLAAIVSLQVTGLATAGENFNRTTYTTSKSYPSKNVSFIVGSNRGLANKNSARKPRAQSAAPLAYQLFCLKSPNECKGGGKGNIKVTSANMAKIDHVNRKINHRIKPKNDSRVDIWSVNVSQGDCEDFALSKRKALIAAGFPASALRLAVVKTRQGEGHAVLVVKTDKGDRILDNRTNAIRAWKQSDLRPIKIAGANPLSWSKVR